MAILGQKVRFVLDSPPTGDLASRRRHARRQTPYPAQMQALIDAQLLTADCYEDHRERRGIEQDARDDEVAHLLAGPPSHVLADLWRKITSLFSCA